MSDGALTISHPIHVRSFDEERKCGGCNWSCCTFYSVDGPVELNYDDGEDPGYERPTGLCASCMMDLLVDISNC